ncbi:hypothetical protein SO802_014000 [Lithocarpus litseifolius]|uniref:Uncharacterized protein n=1 Tax=Lithocarpus litseifolius TaxID=425828 RepID=A0AAW2D8K7_9ROSI
MAHVEWSSTLASIEVPVPVEMSVTQNPYVYEFVYRVGCKEYDEELMKMMIKEELVKMMIKEESNEDEYFEDESDEEEFDKDEVDEEESDEDEVDEDDLCLCSDEYKGIQISCLIDLVSWKRGKNGMLPLGVEGMR